MIDREIQLIINTIMKIEDRALTIKTLNNLINNNSQYSRINKITSKKRQIISNINSKLQSNKKVFSIELLKDLRRIRLKVNHQSMKMREISISGLLSLKTIIKEVQATIIDSQEGEVAVTLEEAEDLIIIIEEVEIITEIADLIDSNLIS